MSFRQLLEKYQQNTATAAEREQVEAELEKYAALTEYLLEEEFQPKMEEDTAAEQEELQKINRSLKWRTRRIVMAAALLACLVMGVVLVFESTWSKWIWYDPTEAAMQEYALDLDCHLAVLSELTMPEVQAEQVSVTERGWGRYDIAVRQRDWSEGDYHWLDGTVTRGEIALHTDAYRPAVGNVFSRGTAEMTSIPEKGGVIQDVATAQEALADVPDTLCLETYVSLAQDWSMAELADFADAVGSETGWLGWVGVRHAPLEEQCLPLMGFDAGSSGYIYDQVDEAYPFYELSLHADTPQDAAWEQHFYALLQYSVDHSDFYTRLNQMGNHGTKCRQVLDYVTRNGVQTYGFVYYGTPSDIRKILAYPEVEGICVSDCRAWVPGLS